MQRLINNEDDQDRVNNDMQMDVTGTRELNVNIKKQIGDTDAQRGDAISRLRSLQLDRDHKANVIDEMKDEY